MKSKFWLILLLILVVPIGAFAQVIFTEVMYDLPDPGGDAGREWVEIQNIGNAPVDLSGWKFFEGGTNHALVIAQGNVILPPGLYAVIVDKPERFFAEHPGFSGTIFDSVFSLNNTNGEKLVLKNASSTVISEVVYSQSWGAKGSGDSLQYFTDGWSAALPTPGAINIKKPVQPIIPAVSAKKEEVVSKSTVSAIEENSGPENLSLEEESLRVEDVAIFEEEIRTEPIPSYVWWVLLGLLIIVAASAYWIGGRNKGEEFIIIEEGHSE